MILCPLFYKLLVCLDQHIRKLEYELYQKFIGIKENLNSLVVQGFDIFSDIVEMDPRCFYLDYEISL